MLRKLTILLSLSLLGLLFAPPAPANPIVRVTTPLGEFFLELFQQAAPGTVANFLNYVNAGRYNGTVVHRSEPGFVIQGGWLSYDGASNSLNAVATYPPIANEFNQSNLRGTIAMAKMGGDPNSATSQWFINLADNTGLDSSNGGFTVFGRVLDNGMQIVDTIQSLPRWRLTQSIPFDFPMINFDGMNLAASNFVTVNMAPAGTTTDAVNWFDEGSGRLHVKVNAGSSGLAALQFNLVSTQPAAVIRLDLSSINYLSSSVALMARFDAGTGLLVLPELRINNVVAFRNVRFQLTDPNLFLFKLESYDP